MNAVDATAKEQSTANPIPEFEPLSYNNLGANA